MAKKKQQAIAEIPNGEKSSNKPKLSTTSTAATNNGLKFKIKINKSKDVTSNGDDSSAEQAQPLMDDDEVTIKELLQNGASKRVSGGVEDKKRKRKKEKEKVQLEDVRETRAKKKKSKRKEVDEEEEEEDMVEEEKSESALGQIPINRISRIVRSEDLDLKISQEAIFLINRATEKFLQLLSKEAYACAFLDRKKSISYNHLSAVVSKREKLNFLSDFVPEKVKAEEALARISEAEK